MKYKGFRCLHLPISLFSFLIDSFCQKEKRYCSLNGYALVDSFSNSFQHGSRQLYKSGKQIGRRCGNYCSKSGDLRIFLPPYHAHAPIIALELIKCFPTAERKLDALILDSPHGLHIGKKYKLLLFSYERSKHRCPKKQFFDLLQLRMIPSHALLDFIQSKISLREVSSTIFVMHLHDVIHQLTHPH